MEKTTKAVHICIYDIIREDVYPRTYRNTSPAGGVSAKLKNKVSPRAPRISYPCGANFRLKLKNKVSPRAPRISGPCGADFQLKLKNKVCEFYIEDNGDGVETEPVSYTHLYERLMQVRTGDACNLTYLKMCCLLYTSRCV